VTALFIRGMAQRRLRSALTGLAILLGVAMIAGTYVQTDQIRSAFTDIEQTAYSGTDVVITQREAFKNDFAYAVPDFDESVVEDVAQVDGVRLVRGSIYQGGSLIRDGEAVGSDFAPSIVMSESGEPFSPARYVSGRAPEAGEVTVNSKLADDENLRVGESLQVATRTGIQDVKLAGVFDYGDVASVGGATIIAAPLADVQTWYRMQGLVTSVEVAGDPGVAPEELARRISAAIPPELRARTGVAEATAQADDINDELGSFLTPMLLSLAGAAVLVGAFIIFNTFSITVAQRTREFALLRSLGATRGQLIAWVVGEALFIGIAASVLGILAGLGFAAALGALFDAIGFGIPRSGLTLAPRTIAVSLIVGIGVSSLAALSPALRATRVPPVLAMAGTVEPSERSRRLAPFLAGATFLAAIGLLVVGLFAGGPAVSRLGGIAGGAVLLFVAIALSARWVVRPVAAAVGLPIERATGLAGRLARENAVRNPGRTATTSAALMVGLGLVVFVAVFAAGLKESVRGSVDELIRADFVIGEINPRPLPAGAEVTLALTRGVDAVEPILFDRVQVNGAKVKGATDTIEAIDPETLPSVYNVDWVKGSDATLGEFADGEALIESSFAEAHDLRVGDRFQVQLPSGRGRAVTAVGEYEDPQLLQGVLVTRTDFERLSSSRDPILFMVKSEDGVDEAAMHRTLEASLEDFPEVDVRTRAEYLDDLVGQLDQMVNLLYALLAMSVVISLFGLANSLILSIHERTREFGLLRAVGATDRQVRRVVRYESVITSVIGGVLGIVVGLVFAALVTAALSDLGLGFAVPAGQLLFFLLLAIVVGVVGAIAPARRGARIDVLEALRHE
jgi:putative ABC transport system permease protein